MKRMWSKNELKNIAGAKATEVIESGEVENAKPIFWHSCTFKKITGGSLVFYFDFIIMINDDTPFTKDTFMSWLNAFESSIEIKVVQGYASAKPNDLVSYFTKSSTPTTIAVKTIDLTTGEVNTSYISIDSDTSFSDSAPNKIN